MQETTQKKIEAEHEIPGVRNVQSLAKGGMSLVYRGIQTSLNRDVVIKKIRPELKGNPEILERFKREARAMANVLHQNVAHVYDFVDQGSDSYIVMEHIEGLDLSSVIQKIGPMSASVSAAVAIGMCRGLAFIHERGLIHRDIKPANVRLTPKGEVKLMDFGIVMDQDCDGLTRPGVMVGSPSYLSPEQILGEKLTPTSDLFLVGICLYEMLTGTRPFEDKGDASVFRHIREGKYTPLNKVRSSLPRELTTIVDRCLQTDPRNRYRSAVDLVAALERFLGEYQSRYYEKQVVDFLEREALLHVQHSEIPQRSQDSLERPAPRRTSWMSLVSVGLLAFFVGYFASQMLSPTTTAEVPKTRPIRR